MGQKEPGQEATAKFKTNQNDNGHEETHSRGPLIETSKVQQSFSEQTTTAHFCNRKERGDFVTYQSALVVSQR